MKTEPATRRPAALPAPPVPPAAPAGLSLRRLLPVLFSRVAAFFLVACLGAVLLYLIGAVQDFLDATQRFLLRLAAGLGVLLAIAAAAGAILDLVLLAVQRRLARLAGAACYLALALTGLAAAAGAFFVLAVAEGNAP